MTSLPAVLGLAYLVSEIGVAATKRGVRAGAERKDRGSLMVLWIAISLGIGLAIELQGRAPGSFRLTAGWSSVALVVIALGIVVRWWAIRTLGRMFTVDVSILDDHELVVRGPFRFVRHPSYTGALLAFLGLGVSFGNVVSILAAFVPFFCALLYRVHVEEGVLRARFGSAYEGYAARTKRFLPGLF